MLNTNINQAVEAIYNKAIEYGFTNEQAQMILNCAHDIAKNGEQTEIQLLSQFY
jgi:hypothetical protein